MAFHQGIIPSLTYPLGVGILNKNQYYDIQAAAIEETIKKDGDSVKNRKIYIAWTSTVWRRTYSTPIYRIRHTKIQMIIGHVRKDDKTRNIIKVVIAYVQQVVGIKTQMLKSKLNDCKACVTPSWIAQVWKFVSDISGE